MKRLAIISEFNRKNINYGNRLQAMALKQYLLRVFPEYEIVYLYFDFWDKFIFTKKNIFQKINRVLCAVCNRINKLKKFERIEERLSVCDSFSINNMTLSDKAYKWKDLLNSDFDAIIVGSDVVWAQGKSKIGRLRFLDFDLKELYVRISYAASFGIDWIPKENIKEIKRCLDKFKMISVRENSSVKLLDDIGIKAVHVVDPTLLLSRDEWVTYEKTPDILQENSQYRYVFTYLLGTDMEMRNSITKWAKSYKLKIVTVPYASGLKNNADYKYGDVQIMNCSPENWLWLVNHAEYVITDSFHGSVFSTIFEKKLIVMQRKSKVDINNRMIDFLSMIGQSDKMISSKELEKVNNMKWDYVSVRNKLCYKIEYSKRFLEEALKNVPEKSKKIKHD